MENTKVLIYKTEIILPHILSKGKYTSMRHLNVSFIGYKNKEVESHNLRPSKEYWLHSTCFQYAKNKVSFMKLSHSFALYLISLLSILFLCKFNRHIYIYI